MLSQKKKAERLARFNSETASTSSAVIDLTQVKMARIAHQGGKLTTNKDKAQAAFLKRIQKNGTENLSSAQRQALSRIPGGAELLHASYGLPSSSSSSSSTTTSSIKNVRNKKNNNNGNTNRHNNNNHNNNNNNNQKQQHKKVCSYYLKGTCKMGRNCTFSHNKNSNNSTGKRNRNNNQMPSNNQPNTTRSNKKQRRMTTPRNNSNNSNPCNFWLKGNCRQGSECQFSHAGKKGGSINKNNSNTGSKNNHKNKKKKFGQSNLAKLPINVTAKLGLSLDEMC